MIAVSLFLPEEISARVQGLYLSPARVIFLVLTPILLIRFGQKITSGRYRFVYSDLFVPTLGVWMIVSFAQTNGLQDALQHAGPLVLEFCIGYFSVRLLLSEQGQAISLVNVLCWAIAVTGCLALLDTMTGQFFVHRLVQFVFPGRLEAVPEFRYGLVRAASTNGHPILFGTACAIGFLLSLAIPTRGFVKFGCALGALLALSAAPLQAAFIGLGLLFYGRMTAGTRLRWGALIALGAVSFLMLVMSLDRPFSFICNHFTFDEESCFFRIYIWQTGGDAAMASPWFGYGFLVPEDFNVPGTVDAVWLEMALEFGIPASILLALSLIGATSRPITGTRVYLTSTASELGTMLGILVFLITLVGFTVHYWGNDWILIAVVIGIRAHLGELGNVAQAHSPAGFPKERADPKGVFVARKSN